MSQITKIVLTGGPCAGKTTALQEIYETFTQRGYKVFIIGESATEMMNVGAKPFGNLKIPIYQFQKEILKYQLYKESMYERFALTLSSKTKSLLICDRGTLDNKAYLDVAEFYRILDELSIKEIDLLTRYQMILHLVTAANGAEEFYTLENNQQRKESPEEARMLDHKTLSCWLGHPNLHVITNNQTFQDKINQVIHTIHKGLDNPVPIQKQKKLLVDASSVENFLKNTVDMKKFRITQTYVDGEEECCFRKMSDGEASTYFEIHKKETKDPTVRIKTMSAISEKEYLRRTLDSTKIAIVKDRYSFVYENQYFQLDVFRNLELCLLEVEATEQNRSLSLPPEFVILDDVTENSKYRNFRLFEQINQKQKEKVF